MARRNRCIANAINAVTERYDGCPGLIRRSAKTHTLEVKFAMSNARPRFTYNVYELLKLYATSNGLNDSKLIIPLMKTKPYLFFQNNNKFTPEKTDQNNVPKKTNIKS